MYVNQMQGGERAQALPTPIENILKMGGVGTSKSPAAICPKPSIFLSPQDFSDYPRAQQSSLCLGIGWGKRLAWAQGPEAGHAPRGA